jgi:hypothetical protein
MFFSVVILDAPGLFCPRVGLLSRPQANGIV